MLPPNKQTLGYIPNALDYSTVDPQRREVSTEEGIQRLRELGIEAELLDLTNYFSDKDALKRKLTTLGGVWVRGGNVFVLRQAMKLSALDEILIEYAQAHTDFVYGGYSAAGCVLSPTLMAYQIVDDATETPYTQQHSVIWEGLGLIDYAFLPHYQSDHPESGDIDKEVEYCQEHQIPYKTLRDGEVIIIE